MRIHVLSLLLVAVSPCIQADESFQVENVAVTDATVKLDYAAEDGFYYILYRGDELQTIAHAIDMAIAPGAQLKDADPGERREAFYRVEKVPVAESKDSDGDGIFDAEELRHKGILNPLDKEDAERDFDNDGKTNKQELKGLFGASDLGDAVFDDVTFKTEDDFTIAASLGIPDNGAELMPAVIFIHQGGSNRSEWESVAKRAFRKGWVTLAYDIRGHGKSTGNWTNAWYDDPDNAPKDLQAAIDHLQNLPEVDKDRIGVVGASVGGNLACVASARYDVKTAVAISHKTSAVFNLAGLESLVFQSIYHLSSEGDQGGQRAEWARELHEQTQEPRELEITKGSGHGVAVFKTDSTVPDRILAWLDNTL